MQQKRRTIGQKCILALTGIIWVAGLLMAGSDSPFMPWTNGFGLLLFLSASVLLGRQLGSPGIRTEQIIVTKIKQKHTRPVQQAAKSNQRMKIRYAL